MHDHAFQAQCLSAEGRFRPPAEQHAALIVLALALGTFAIGTAEFGSNGEVQLLAADLDVSVPVATYAVMAYALGVVVGSPALSIVGKPQEECCR